MSECNCGLTTGCPVCMPDNVTNKQQVKNGVTISVFASDVYDPKGLAWRERAEKAEAQLKTANQRIKELKTLGYELHKPQEQSHE